MRFADETPSLPGRGNSAPVVAKQSSIDAIPSDATFNRSVWPPGDSCVVQSSAVGWCARLCLEVQKIVGCP